MRYLTEDGVFIPLREGQTDTTVEGAQWWAESYDGAFGRIWYGHQPFEDVRINMHAIGIDTEAYSENGRLTAMNVVTGETFSA